MDEGNNAVQKSARRKQKIISVQEVVKGEPHLGVESAMQSHVQDEDEVEQIGRERRKRLQDGQNQTDWIGNVPEIEGAVHEI